MPRPGGRPAPEKSKDFFGSMKRLIKNLKPWKYIMILALTLAMISAILALVAPNKLSDFADTISKGLAPNVEKLTEISEKITRNLSQEKISYKMSTIMESNVPVKDIQEFQSIMMNMQNVTEENRNTMFMTMPESVLEYLLEDIVVDGKTISVKDQVEMFKLYSKMGGEEKTEKALALICRLSTAAAAAD